MHQLLRKLQKAAEANRIGALSYHVLGGGCGSDDDEELRYPIVSKSPSTPTKKNKNGWRSEDVTVPEGFLPVYVGDDATRFVICARFLNHPIFVELLQISAQEYGYEQQGVLRIPCDVTLFEHIMCVLGKSSFSRNLSLKDMTRPFSFS